MVQKIADGAQSLARDMRLSYVPPLMVYFAAGVSGFTGIIEAFFTMADFPLGQVAMIPMLAWIAKEAPRNQKATYFAVMAAFTNLALSAGQLGTKYLNRIFVVERGRYDELGLLMIVTMILGLVMPVVAVWALQPGATGGRPNLPERPSRLRALFSIRRSHCPYR